MTARYALGIDLGTTNCVLALCDLADDAETGAASSPNLRTLEIPQLTAVGTVESRPALPSFLYLPTQAERESQSLGLLPWQQEAGDVVCGVLARDRADENPTRTIAAAKSWLAHSQADRRAPILPWQSPEASLSPVAACRGLLAHLVAAWADAAPNAPIAEQRVVLTVPASFDAAARELVREAAEGLLPSDFTLLEEPQAALYAWLAAEGEQWREQLGVGDRVFVCDVGGGTTDFTLVDVEEEEGELTLQRAAVGRHLLVGGDNMDLALAHYAAGRFAEEGVSLDPWQSVSLWHACRRAKEQVLAVDGPETVPIAVARRGRSLVAGTSQIQLEAEPAADLLATGFFPDVALDAEPEVARASGFLEMGLPFEQDTAITRHIAAFLRQHCLPGDGSDGSDDAVRSPTRVLFNGGVFEADRFREQVIDRLLEWFPEQTCENLDAAADLHCAVARGAAFYAHTLERGGVRIRGGAPRSYYLGLETSGLAIPGAPRPLHAVCVLPRGMEEGTETAVPVEGVGVVVGQPVQFRFFSSSTRTDEPGQRLTTWSPDELEETDPVQSTLEPGEHDPGAFVPVDFQSRLSELGELELYCVADDGEQRWEMRFNVREQDAASEAAAT